MAKSSKTINLNNNYSKSINIARELSEYSQVFKKYSNRKSLKPYEKGLITKEKKKFDELYNYFDGDLGQLKLIPESLARSLKKQGRGDELFMGFNVLKLNNRAGGLIKQKANGDLLVYYKRPNAANPDFQAGRNINFVRVKLNWDFTDEDIADTDPAISYIIKRYRTEFKKRKIPVVGDYELTPWTANGGLVSKYAAYPWRAFETRLIEFLERYIPIWVADGVESAGDKLHGFAYYLLRKTKKAGVPDDKKKSKKRKKNRRL